MSDLPDVSFIRRLEGVLDAARFAASVLDKPEDRLYHAEDRTWWRRDGNKLACAEAPASLSAWMEVAQAVLAHPSTAWRHSDYCKVGLGGTCICPEKVLERERRRRAADPLLRAVDKARGSGRLENKGSA